MSEDLLEIVADLVRQVIGEEWADEVQITASTSFSDELELESMRNRRRDAFSSPRRMLPPSAEISCRPWPPNFVGWSLRQAQQC